MYDPWYYACYRVIDHESKNKMGPSNLIRLFGPTLMTVDGDPVSLSHRYNYGENYLLISISVRA